MQGALAFCQALIRERAEAGTALRVFLVTRTAVAVGAPHSMEPLQALVWGLARTFAIEHPRVWGGLVDLRPDRLDPAADAGDLAAELLAPRTGRRCRS